MSPKWPAVACGLAALLLAPPTRADTLQTDLGPLELPFALTEGFSMREVHADAGIYHHRTQKIRVDSGPMLGTWLMLDTEVLFPVGTDVARLADMDAAHVARLAAVDGTHVEAIRWNGLDFHFIDVPLSAAEMVRATGVAGGPMRSLELSGVLGEAHLGVGIRIPADAPEAGAIADALRAMRLDDSGVTVRQAEFLARVSQPIADRVMQGAFVDLVAPEGTFVREGARSTSSASPGQVVARSAGYAVARGSAYAHDFDAFFSKCEAHLDADASRRWRFMTPVDGGPGAKGVPTRLGGIDGIAFETPAQAHGDRQARMATYLWMGERDGTGYALTLRRSGDRALTDALLAQLRDATFACRLDERHRLEVATPGGSL
jgi:hypothetical protein